MMKEMMDILKDLNHRPTDQQKKRLNEMAEELEKKMERHEKRMKKMR